MKTIFVQHRFWKLHCWPEAPEPVAYLRNLHRHEFHVELSITVEHGDRELEFHMVLDWLEKVCNNIMNNPDNTLSCEQMGDLIMDQAKSRYKDRSYIVEVSEDGKNGARIYN